MNVKRTINYENIKQLLFTLFAFVVRITSTGTMGNLPDHTSPDRILKYCGLRSNTDAYKVILQNC